MHTNFIYETATWVCKPTATWVSDNKNQQQLGYVETTYRGYRWDNEISMFYLNSRFYCPEMSRFINEDNLLGVSGDIQSTNMYAYCTNNPIMFIDSYGDLAIPFPTTNPYIYLAILIAIGILYIAGVLGAPGATDVLNRLNLGFKNINELINAAKMALAIYLATLVMKYVSGRDWHHIVAKSDLRAIVGRLVLGAANIGINSGYNLAYVRRGLHQVLHTGAYHALVSSTVTLAYFIGGRDGVIAVLSALKLLLEV